MATLRVSKGLSWDAISVVRKKERILMSDVCKDCPTGKQNKTQTPFLTKKKNVYRCEFQTFLLPMREIELRVKEIWMTIIKVFVVNQIFLPFFSFCALTRNTPMKGNKTFIIALSLSLTQNIWSITTWTPYPQQ